MKVLVVGGGNMGTMFAERLVEAEVVSSDDLLIYEKSEERVVQLKEMQIGQVFSEIGEYFKSADVYILAVKPQDSQSVFKQIKEYITSDKMVLSIMAGIHTSTIQESLGVEKVIRAMPNLPCKLGQGVTGYITSSLNDDEKKAAREILESTGLAVELDREEMIDSVTAVSGSGPAYVFYFIDSMVQAAMQLGLSSQDANQLVIQTFEGSLYLLKEGDLSCQEWISRVASKGGTTEAAIQTFDAFDVKNNIGKGILRAEARAKELNSK